MRMNFIREKSIEILLLLAGFTSILIVLAIFGFIGKEAAPFLITPGWELLFSTRWMPVSFQQQSFGILPLIGGSLLVTAIATVIALPFGILGAVYIAEMAGDREKEFLKPFIEILSGIPSVVFGFFGLVVLAPIIKDLFHLPSGLTALTGAVLLALMACPTIISIAEDAVTSVPREYKQASLALGASRFQTIWKVIVPAALPGVIAAVMLGMGRVIGETMTVLMVTGNAAIMTLSPFESVRTMTATIAGEMGEVPFGSDHYRALFVVGIVLLLLTFLVNLTALRALKNKRRTG